MQHLKKNGLLIYEVILLSGLFYLYLGLDMSWAVSLYPIFGLAFTILALPLAAPALLSRQRKPGFWILTVFVLAVFSLRYMVSSPVKQFNHLQQDIANGMTPLQVHQLLIDRFPTNGPFYQPKGRIDNLDSEGIAIVRSDTRLTTTPDQLLRYILDPNDGAMNAEVLTVYLKNGRVVGTDYSSD